MSRADGRPDLDLTRYHFKRVLGDIVLYGTWIWSDDMEDSEPCLVLLPRYRTLGKPVGVALSKAHLYNEPRYLVRAAAEFAIEMGFGMDKRYAIRIADILNSHLDDLVLMPPEPTTTVVVADGTSIDQDGNKRTFEILDHLRQ